MRIETTTRELYKFDELDDKAKEKAREWWREASINDDSFWSECVIDDAKEQLKLLGFNVEDIYWSGFWSQGDGACFVGSWSARDVQVDRLKRECGAEPLLQICHEFEALQAEFPEASATIKHRGNYSHKNCTEFECEGFGTDESWDGQTEKEFIELARLCMDWIYRELENAYVWQNADEQVDESIIANGYEFTKDGRIA